MQNQTQTQTERAVSFTMNGWVAVAIVVLLSLVIQYLVPNNLVGTIEISGTEHSIPIPLILRLGLVAVVFSMFNFGTIILGPNEAMVYKFFGNYKGTLDGPGYYWVPFWLVRYKRYSRAEQTICIDEIEVNDKTGNPVIVACDIFVILKDTYAAAFLIKGVKKYLYAKGQVALRKLVMSHPMDITADGDISLQGNHDKVVAALETLLAEEFGKTGYMVVKAAITHLSYAKEIAAEMLQKQRATALVAARQKIAEGAFGIVKEILDKIEKEEGLTLTDAGKATFVSNMMIVLSSSQSVSPVLTVNS